MNTRSGDPRYPFVRHLPLQKAADFGTTRKNKVMAQLPTTITLNVGSPAADRVYTRAESSNPGVALYYAASPNGDLAGRPSLTVRHNNSSSGLVTTIAQFREPVLNTSTGKYDSWIQSDLKVTRPDTAPLQDAKTGMELVEEFLETSNVRDALAEMSY